MTYSEKEMREIERDPVRLRAYYWHIAHHWLRLARILREESKQDGVLHPPQNYRRVFEKGSDTLRWADTLESSASVVLDNIDDFVQTTLKTD